MLKIYGRANSINVRKVLWAVDELGLQYTRADWGRGFSDTQTPEFLALNPFGLIPVLVDGDATLRESHAIIRYLAAKQGADTLYPTDLLARARVDAWLDWAGADTIVGFRGVFLGGFIGQEPFNDPAFMAHARADLLRLMKIVDAELERSGGPYITGTNFTIADIPLGLVVHRWYTLEADGPKLPTLQAYYDKLNERKAYQTHGRNGTP